VEDLDAGDLLAADPPPGAAVGSAPSLPPAGRPSGGLPSLPLGEEREASLVLAEGRMREAFVERAAWLLEEARLVEDAAARAAQLLVVGELLALCGGDEQAAEVADEAIAAHPAAPLATRQRRAFLAKRGDFTAVLDAVDAETRAMPSPEARCHGSWLGAEI